MQIIPVIDLKDGVVVHAKAGRRESYQPMHSPLCPSADLFDAVRAYLKLSDFRTFYIADLDALEGKNNHEKLIARLAESFPERQFWLDQGIQPGSAHGKRPVNIKTVLGSESLDNETLARLADYHADFILSLDHKDGIALGAPSLFSSPELWPKDIILMTLDRVGSHSGPDIEKLASYREAWPGKNIIAAGGTRDMEDLRKLQRIGIAQCLIASALHSGAIGSRELAFLQAKKYPNEWGIF